MAVWMPRDRKEALVEQARGNVTLNGNSATVSGTGRDFATVRDSTSGLGCEWSWQAAERVITTHGKFVS